MINKLNQILYTVKHINPIDLMFGAFDLQKYDHLSALNKAIDNIRSRFGEDSIMRASFLKGNVSHMSGGLSKDRRSGITIGIDIDNEKTKIL